VESVLGEPVRAVADGTVNFAGVDYPGARSNENLSRAQIEEVPRRALGNGGRYVCILHHPSDGGWVRSCYMHLEDVEVEWGQEVHRGERIGTVGRTGMRTSAPHLHFELHGPDGLLDPAEIFAGTLLGHEPPPPRRRRRRRR
jgi:murein DD-endopeptidase MepM/ murein hydrolase activator NlpD